MAALLTNQPPRANPPIMTNPKSSKKKPTQKRFLYRDALGRFVSKTRHSQLKKRAKPSKKKSVKTPASHTKPILIKKKKSIKKQSVTKKRAKKSPKKKRISTPPSIKKRKLLTVIKVEKKRKVKTVSQKKVALKKKRKRKPTKIKPPKGFEIPVRGMTGMYNVTGIRGNSVAQLAAMINNQIERGAKRFRFWYSVKTTPAYPGGIASTIIKSWQEVSTRYKGGTEAWLKKLGGKVFHYWFVKAG